MYVQPAYECFFLLFLYFLLGLLFSRKALDFFIVFLVLTQYIFEDKFGIPFLYYWSLLAAFVVFVFKHGSVDFQFLLLRCSSFPWSSCFCCRLDGAYTYTHRDGILVVVVVVVRSCGFFGGGLFLFIYFITRILLFPSSPQKNV